MSRCIKPFISGRAAFGCGQCLPCRLNRRRTWMHRILLEATCHAENSFVTLTYADAERDAPRGVQPAHLSSWIKRLRKRIAPGRVRFFACGEYGDRSERPHYHAALFGYGSCVGGRTNGDGCQCPQCIGVRETWGFGHVLVGTLEQRSAQYVAGYVVKKMVDAQDLRCLDRNPEFARMSLRPGIGADALWDVASVMMRYGQENTLPSQLRHGKKLLPLGRYLRKRLSFYLGHDDELRASLSDQALSHLYEELSLVRSVAWATDKAVKDVFASVNEPYAQALKGRETLKRRKL